MDVKIYGCKGSMAFFSRNNSHYGGNSSCVKVETNGQTIIIDGGSGIMQFSKDIEKQRSAKFDILISHLHMDHIIGLPLFDRLMKPENKIRIFSASRGESSLKSQIFGVFKPPYWPVKVEELIRSEVVEIFVDKPFNIGENVKVIPHLAIHPDKTISFRIEGDKTLVYLLDYEVPKDELQYEKLVQFCKFADGIIFDSCYMPEDYIDKKEWGHSTFESGVKLAKDAHCKTLILTHFNFEYTDAQIDEIDKTVKNDFGINFLTAYDGMEVML